MDQLGGGVWGGVVIPLGLLYVGFVVMLGLYARSRGRGWERRTRQARLPALLRRLAVTGGAGYIILLAIVVVFSFMFADEAQAIREALTEGALLALIGLTGLAFLGWVEGRIRRPRGRPNAGR